MRSGSEHIADRALLVCALAFALATGLLLAFDNRPALVFIQSVAAAALVGGIADWYGIVSIYGRPLGIRFRTAIVVERRAELLEAIEVCVCDRILTSENIKQKLARWEFSLRLLALLRGPGERGSSALKALADFSASLLSTVLKAIDGEELGRKILALSVPVANRVSVSREVVRLGSWTIRHDYDDKLLGVAIVCVRDLSQNPAVVSMVSELAQRAIDTYAGGHLLRKWASSTFKDAVRNGARDALEGFLHGLATDSRHPQRLRLRQQFRDAFERFKHSPEQQARVDRFVREQLGDQQISEDIAQKIAAFYEKLKRTGFEVPFLSELLESVLRRFLDYLATDSEFRSAVDAWLLKQLSELVDQKHGFIRETVRANLAGMHDDELVAFVRDNTEGDLQKIRLNGMAFGVVIGIVVATFRWRVGLF
jgi:uncharacterized membrane-anchored protein YjiN (DUF445 family)